MHNVSDTEIKKMDFHLRKWCKAKGCGLKGEIAASHRARAQRRSNLIVHCQWTIPNDFCSTDLHGNGKLKDTHHYCQFRY